MQRVNYWRNVHGLKIAVKGKERPEKNKKSSRRAVPTGKTKCARTDIADIEIQDQRLKFVDTDRADDDNSILEPEAQYYD